MNGHLHCCGLTKQANNLFPSGYAGIEQIALQHIHLGPKNGNKYRLELRSLAPMDGDSITKLNIVQLFGIIGNNMSLIKIELYSVSWELVFSGSGGSI